MDKNSKIYIAGHNGLAGSAIYRACVKKGYLNIITRNRSELNLEDQAAVARFFGEEKPEYVFLAAAKVGGIHANNTFRADFILINLKIQTNVIDASLRADVRKLMFLGSTCIYPKLCPQPMKEEYLLTGELEQSNEPYAIAKIAGLKTVESVNRQHGKSWVSVMPTNLYGPNDNFHPENSHVLPALMRRIHEAKESGAGKVTVWGTGTPKREFLYVDDMADACVFVMNHDNRTDLLNMGTGEEVSIKELAETIAQVVGYEGTMEFDTSKLDGSPRKLCNVERLLALGWAAKISLFDGLTSTYKWFKDHQNNFRES